MQFVAQKNSAEVKHHVHEVYFYSRVPMHHCHIILVIPESLTYSSLTVIKVCLGTSRLVPLWHSHLENFSQELLTDSVTGTVAVELD